MNVIIYYHKKNFDVQKAQRFFQERRIPFQLADLKKRRLGRKELELFALKAGANNLVDREDTWVREQPACYYSEDQMILDALLDNPRLMRCPVLRCGSRVMVGFDQPAMENWLNQEK